MIRVAPILTLALLLPGCTFSPVLLQVNLPADMVQLIESRIKADLAAPAAATGRADSPTPATVERADAARPGMMVPAGPAKSLTLTNRLNLTTQRED